MADPIRFGVLGAARIAPQALIGPARAVEGVRVQAVAARDPARAQDFARKHGIPIVHARYATLIEDPEVDAVYIPLPNGHHTEWALRALAAGKHVLCEKPLAANAAEANRIAEAAEQAGAPVFMEAFHNRYHPLVQRMRAIVESTELGALRAVDMVFRTPMLRREDIRFEYALAGGATMDLGCYLINLLRFVSGEEPIVERAEADLLRPNVDKRMRASLRLPSGARVTMDVEMQARRFWDIRFVARGESGLLSVVNPVLPGVAHLFTVRTRAGVRREWFPRTPTYVYQLRAFVSAVRESAPIPTDAADGVRTMQVIDTIYRAAGLPVRGDPQAPDQGD
jgi:predicted dehydrogenase